MQLQSITEKENPTGHKFYCGFCGKMVPPEQAQADHKGGPFVTFVYKHCQDEGVQSDFSSPHWRFAPLHVAS